MESVQRKSKPTQTYCGNVGDSETRDYVLNSIGRIIALPLPSWGYYKFCACMIFAVGFNWITCWLQMFAQLGHDFGTMWIQPFNSLAAIPVDVFSHGAVILALGATWWAYVIVLLFMYPAIAHSTNYIAYAITPCKKILNRTNPIECHSP